MKEKVLRKVNCICMLNIDDVFALDRYLEYDSDSASMFGKWEKSMHLYLDIPIEDIETISSLKGVLSLEDELNVYHTELLLRPKRKTWVDKLHKHYNVAKRLFLEFEILDTIDKEKHLDIFEFHVNSALKTYEAYVEEFQIKK